MKPIRYLALILALTLCLSGCTRVTPQNTVSFYYPRNPQQKAASSSDPFYAVEKREITDNTSNLRYLLSLYLQGPLSDNSVSPFPSGTRLVTLDLHAGQLYIQLSREFGRLSGIDLTIACTCISLTCFDLTDADLVTVISSATEDYPAVEVTLSREDLTLTDTVTGAIPPQS